MSPPKPLSPGTIRFLAMCAALATLLLIAAILFHLWRLIMPTFRRHLAGILSLALLTALFLAPYFARFNELAAWTTLLMIFAIVALTMVWPALRGMLARTCAWILMAALAVVGTGCASVPGGSGADVIGTLKEIASDPRCAHTDRVSGNLGGLTGNNLNVFLERSCPAGPAPVPLKAIDAATLAGQPPT